MLKNPCDLHRTASAAPLGPIFMRFTGVQSPKMTKFGLRGVVSDPSGTAPWEFFNKLVPFWHFLDPALRQGPSCIIEPTVLSQKPSRNQRLNSYVLRRVLIRYR